MHNEVEEVGGHIVIAEGELGINVKTVVRELRNEGELGSTAWGFPYAGGASVSVTGVEWDLVLVEPEGSLANI